jgi:serine/threonine protein kinase/Tol biopolymer transport system component
MVFTSAHAILQSAAPADPELFMALAAGARLGPYEILSLLGVGGMGEVYRAHDSKLHRTVAVKVLSDELATPVGRRRFQREAQMSSSLNHPHILTVHDVGELDGRQYIVTEFVDGGTFKEWMHAAPRSWRDSVELLLGVADGLAVAHAAGILHCDVKPENILTTNSGYAKLADFGLAKLHEPAAVDATTRTIADAHTRAGVIVGTVAYMSPEQASGRPVDARSDVFSFATVLYEALAGTRPFAGASDPDVLHAIMHRPADPLPGHVPLPLRMTIEKALEKDPADRYQTMRELVVDLRRLTRQSEIATTPPSGPRGWLRRGLAVGLTVVAVLLIAAALFFSQRRPSRTSFQPLEMQQMTAFTDFATQPALSPDGRLLTFIRGPESFATVGQIYVKLLPNGEPVQLTNDATQKMMPVFSPDGSRIAYTVVSWGTNAWDTWVVPVFGGEPKLWLPNASGLRWTAPGRLLFSEIKNGGLHMALVSATESRTESRDVYVPESIRGMAHRSYLSPDGTSVLLTEMDNGGWLPCRIVPSGGASLGRIVGPPTGQCTHAAWSPDGRTMFFTSNASGSFQIWRQRFPDARPEQLTFGPTEAEGLAVSPDGQSVTTSIGFNQGSIWLHEGERERQVSAEGSALFPAFGDGFPTSVFSPDGGRLYYLVKAGLSRGFGNGELWVADLRTGSRERLLPGLSITSYDISPDGQRLVFAANDGDGKSHIWLARLDRRASPIELTPVEARGPVFGRDDDVYYRGLEGKLWYLYNFKLASGEIRKFNDEPAVNSPRISPDGQWVLSLVPVEGRDMPTELKAFPVQGGPPVTVCAGCFLTWTRDQKALFFSFFPSDGSSEAPTFVVELPPGKALPPLPPGGIQSQADVRKLPVNNVIDHRPGVFPGITQSVYAFRRQLVQRNLYRIVLPQ